MSPPEAAPMQTQGASCLPRLPSPDEVAQLPAAAFNAFLLQLAALALAAAARVPVVAPETAVPAEPDTLLDVAEAAATAGLSVSWMRKHGHKVPGFVQPGGRGTRARWSRRAVVRWTTTETNC